MSFVTHKFCITLTYLSLTIFTITCVSHVFCDTWVLCYTNIFITHHLYNHMCIPSLLWYMYQNVYMWKYHYTDHWSNDSCYHHNLRTEIYCSNYYMSWPTSLAHSDALVYLHFIVISTLSLVLFPVIYCCISRFFSCLLMCLTWDFLQQSNF
jgi:hypothetical protein